MKKITCAILGVLATALLAACGNGSPTKANLRFAAFGDTHETAGYRVLVKQFTDAEQVVGVDSEYMPAAAYWEKLDITIQTGDAPDVFVMDSARASPWVRGNRLLAIDSLDTANAVGAYDPRLKAAVIAQGKSFGVPLTIGVKLLVCSRSWFEKAGMAVPSPTKPLGWHEFTAMLQRLALAGNGAKSLAMPTDLLIQDVLGAYGTSLFSDPATQGKKGFVVEKAREAFSLLKELSAVNSSDGLTPAAKLKEGAVAIAYLSVDELKTLARDGMDLATIPLPVGEFRHVSADVNYLVIPAFTKHPAESWKLIMALVDGEQSYSSLGGNIPANPASFGRPDPEMEGSTAFDTIGSEGPFISIPLAIADQALAGKYDALVGEFLSGLISPEEISVAVDAAVDASLLVKGGAL